MKKEVKTLRNKSKESLLVKVNGEQKEIKAGETFETPKFKELLRLYPCKFELSEGKVKKEENKKEEVKEVKKTAKKK